MWYWLGVLIAVAFAGGLCHVGLVVVTEAHRARAWNKKWNRADSPKPFDDPKEVQPQLFYRASVKYIATRTMVFQLNMATAHALQHDVRRGGVELTQNGRLTIQKGFACDGPSGPAIDTPNAMRAAFIHDALYYLSRQGLLPDSPAVRYEADVELHHTARSVGMTRLRGFGFFYGVRIFAAYAADPSHRSRELYAP